MSRKVTLWVAATLLFTQLARAQEERCIEAASIVDCLNKGYESVDQDLGDLPQEELQRMGQERSEEISEEADRSAREAATSTGTDPSTEGASLTNFLSPFLALVDSGQLDAQGQKLAIETAVQFLNELDKDLKVQVVFNDPKLFAPFKTKLTNDGMTDRADTLEGTLEDVDDLTIRASWSRVNEKYGRSIEYHRDIFSKLFDKAAEEAFKEGGSEALQREQLNFFSRLSERFQQSPKECPGADPGEIPIRCLTAEDRRQIFEAGRHAALFKKSFQDKLADKHLDKLNKLLNNQPQLIASVSYTARDDLAGPNETAASFQYEMGVVNINSMKKACPETRSDLLGCYSDYLSNEKRQSSLEANNRLALQVEYTEIDDLSFTIPGNEAAKTDEISFAQPGSSSWTLSATYGRYLWVSGQQSARLDFSVAGEWYDDDKPADAAMMAEAMQRQNRLVTSLTYTQMLNKQTGAVVGLTWASKPEFLGDVTRKIGARAGLTYKILGGKSGNGNGG